MEKEQFQVTVKAEEDKIHGLVRGNLKESYEYAFYLKKNGQRTATQWYGIQSQTALVFRLMAAAATVLSVL